MPDFHVYKTRFFVCSPAVFSAEECVHAEIGLDKHMYARVQQKPRRRNRAKTTAHWNPSDAEIDAMCAAFVIFQMSWCFIDTHTVGKIDIGQTNACRKASSLCVADAHVLKRRDSLRRRAQMMPQVVRVQRCLAQI